MKELKKVIIIGALVMIFVYVLTIDFDDLSSFKTNQNSYIGVLSMLLVALSLGLSIKTSKK